MSSTTLNLLFTKIGVLCLFNVASEYLCFTVMISSNKPYY